VDFPLICVRARRYGVTPLADTTLLAGVNLLTVTNKANQRTPVRDALTGSNQ
jgi:hypothetical protein